MIMPTELQENMVRFCQTCGMQIPKSKYVSWKNYSKRKYCGKGKLCIKGRANKEGVGKDLSVSEYIGLGSKNGRLMADFNLGVLKAVEKIDDDKDIESILAANKGVICKYKGIAVTADVVKTANQWLMDNWLGKAGQRTDGVKEPEADREELEAGLLALEEEIE